MEWRGLEATVSSIQMNIAKLESKSKSLSMTIMMMQNKLKEERRNVADENPMKVGEQVTEVQHDNSKSNEVVEGSTWPAIVSEQVETETRTPASNEKVVDKEQRSIANNGGNVKISVSKLYADDDL